jgi:cell division protein FtsL
MTPAGLIVGLLLAIVTSLITSIALIYYSNKKTTKYATQAYSELTAAKKKLEDRLAKVNKSQSGIKKLSRRP